MRNTAEAALTTFNQLASQLQQRFPFTNYKQGLITGASLGFFASCFMTLFSKPDDYPELSRHCLQTMCLSALFGLVIGALGDLTNMIFHDNRDNRTNVLIHKITTLLFLTWVALNIVIGFQPELGQFVQSLFFGNGQNGHPSTETQTRNHATYSPAP